MNQNRLRELLTYNPETGCFYWNIDRGLAKQGAIAGYTRKNGYIQIGLDGRIYLAHRLVWMYVHGEWPSDKMDHRDGVKTNNALRNLRCVSQGENKQNLKRAQRNNKSGYLGVSPYGDKWSAQIYLHGRQIQLGVFTNPKEAHEVYIKAKRELHPFYDESRSAV